MTNKILSVLIKKPSKTNTNSISKYIHINKIDIVLDYISENSNNTFSEINTQNYINKFLENNIEYSNKSQTDYTLHIKIINNDGNINDCISYLIFNLFTSDNTVYTI